MRLEFDAANLLHRHRPGPFSLPLELPFLALVGGLLFSSLLAWYLTVPAWRLRMGFERLAGGELGVRLKGLMGRRRDEIADLAGDFDQMAERMQSLVESRERLLHGRVPRAPVPPGAAAYGHRAGAQGSRSAISDQPGPHRAGIFAHG